MILVGQYDSPFVRRVGVALQHYRLPYEHRPWSVWGDAERIAELNPLRRVPVLVLDDGTSLIECFAILDTNRKSRPSRHWLGDELSHADIAFACAVRFTREAHPELFDPRRVQCSPSMQRAARSSMRFAA